MRVWSVGVVNQDGTQDQDLNPQLFRSRQDAEERMARWRPMRDGRPYSVAEVEMDTQAALTGWVVAGVSPGCWWILSEYPHSTREAAEQELAECGPVEHGVVLSGTAWLVVVELTGQPRGDGMTPRYVDTTEENTNG